MIGWYFVKIPRLPGEVKHQTGRLKLLGYAATEGSAVEPGQVIARIENFWARMSLLAVKPGVLKKQIFEEGFHLREGDPLAVLIADPEEMPAEETCRLRIDEWLNEKPARKP